MVLFSDFVKPKVENLPNNIKYCNKLGSALLNLLHSILSLLLQ